MIALYLASRADFFPDAEPSDVWFVAALELMVEALILSLIIGKALI